METLQARIADMVKTRIPRHTIGERIRYKRERAGMTRRELAKAIDVWKDRIAQFENGEAVPREDTVSQMAEAFGIKYADMMQNVEPYVTSYKKKEKKGDREHDVRVGGILERLRNEANMTRQELKIQANLPSGYVGRIESGAERLYRGRAQRIANVLGTDISNLMIEKE